MPTKDDLPTWKDEPTDRGTRSTSQAIVKRFIKYEAHTAIDTPAVEEPLELQLAFGPLTSRQVKSISITMRTPGHDFELVAGFLLTEGIVSDSADISKISYISGRFNEVRSTSAGPNTTALPYQPERNVVRVELAPDVAVSMANLERNFYTTSSCGICGKASLLALRAVCPPRAANNLEVAANLLYSLPGRLRAGRTYLKGQAACTHRVCLMLADTSTPSERMSGVIMQWTNSWEQSSLPTALHFATVYFCYPAEPASNYCRRRSWVGIPMVVSVGAPSSLAVQVAKEFDITLIGFLRDDHFNVYHGAERIPHTSAK